ncbi:MAG: gamma-glutamylcyclotransferase family protein [bacterium]|nr:gamma-glutamylcyclotransferase family protein [bacterium]
MSRTFVFGYGSLLNELEVQRTLPGKAIFGHATLIGWRRKFNKGGLDHRYLNLVPANSEVRQVEGTLIEVTPAELAALARREPGYEMVDVTSQVVAPPEDSVVLAFIAPSFEKLLVRRSYLERIRPGVPPEEWEQWLQETDFSGISTEVVGIENASMDEEG